MYNTEGMYSLGVCVCCRPQIVANYIRPSDASKMVEMSTKMLVLFGSVWVPFWLPMLASCLTLFAPFWFPDRSSTPLSIENASLHEVIQKPT